MPDSPDYSKYQIGSVRFSLQDLGELAIRLGSSDYYDRRGNVICLDNFSYGLAPYQTLTNGAGSAVSIIAASDVGSGYQAKISSAASAGAYAELSKYFTPAYLGKHGYELAVSVQGVSGILRVTADLWDNSARYTPYIEYSVGLDTIVLAKNGGGTVTVVSHPHFVLSPYVFNHIKLIVDYETGLYVRLMVNRREYDISAYTMPTQAGTATESEQVLIRMSRDGAVVSNAFLASLIVTTDEVK